MAPILVSASIILGTLFTGDLVRNLIVNPKLSDDSLIKKILLDSILALELCASSFEIGVIFQHYGMVAWTFCVFFSTFYQLSRWRGLAMPSTNTHILDCLSGKASLMEGLIRNVILVSVGLLAHRYVLTYVHNRSLFKPFCLSFHLFLPAYITIQPILIATDSLHSTYDTVMDIRYRALVKNFNPRMPHINGMKILWVPGNCFSVIW